MEGSYNTAALYNIVTPIVSFQTVICTLLKGAASLVYYMTTPWLSNQIITFNDHYVIYHITMIKKAKWGNYESLSQFLSVILEFLFFYFFRRIFVSGCLQSIILMESLLYHFTFQMIFCVCNFHQAPPQRSSEGVKCDKVYRSFYFWMKWSLFFIPTSYYYILIKDTPVGITHVKLMYNLSLNMSYDHIWNDVCY